MYCPVCRDEYRPGFTRCASCDVDLVASLDAGAAQPPAALAPEIVVEAATVNFCGFLTLEEARAHLGIETQRQWTTRAIGRATPCLLGLFSLVVLLAHALHPQDLPARQAAWYPKATATFADALAAVRRHLWASWNCAGSAAAPDVMPIPRPIWDSLHEAVCYAA